MSVNVKCKCGQLSNTPDTTILQCPADKEIHILEMTLVCDGTNRTINLKKTDDSEAATSKLVPTNFALTANYTLKFHNIILEESDILKGDCSAASVVDYDINYIESDTVVA